MLGVLYARSKPWILSSHAHLHGLSPSSSAAHYHHRNRHLQLHLHHHSGSGRFIDCGYSAASSIWRVIRPSGCSRGRRYVRRVVLAEPRGEGSWNVAWDARPARWLHRPDSAWLLFGVSGLGPAATTNDVIKESDEKIGDLVSDQCDSDRTLQSINDFKITGVLADGRCLFRAIAHGACLRSGEEVPDENRQRELADELRALVVDELLKRREETEWFIEGDFDTYVKRIQEPYVWGGEPELLMAAHVLKTMISVFMTDRTSGKLVNIANYGEEYRKDRANVKPINVLFHGYGHYDILETSDQSNLYNSNI